MPDVSFHHTAFIFAALRLSSTGVNGSDADRTSGRRHQPPIRWRRSGAFGESFPRLCFLFMSKRCRRRAAASGAGLSQSSRQTSCIELWAPRPGGGIDLMITARRVHQAAQQVDSNKLGSGAVEAPGETDSLVGEAARLRRPRRQRGAVALVQARSISRLALSRGLCILSEYRACRPSARVNVG